MQRLALPVFLLLGSILPAQEKALLEKKVHDLRTANKALETRLAAITERYKESRREMQRQRAMLDQLKEVIAQQNVKKAEATENAQAKKARQAAIEAEKARLVAQKKAKARAQAQARRAQVLVRRNFRLAPARPAPRNPMLEGEYKKALDALAASRRKLLEIQDPKAARALVDTMTKQLQDVRRALWEIDQKAKKQATTDKDK